MFQNHKRIKVEMTYYDLTQGFTNPVKCEDRYEP